MIVINPYIVFKGTCEEAFNFYKEVFGGEILFMGRYKDVPQESKRFFPNALDEKIMHATLQINRQVTLMGNDSPEAIEQPKGVAADGYYLYMSTDSKDDAYRVFDELSVEGKITLPIAPTFWSTHYGMVIDKFGIHWKITFDAGQ